MNGTSSAPPGFNELATFIVSSLREAAVEDFADRLDVESRIEEAALMQIAKEELEGGVLSASQAVLARIRQDLNA